MVRVSINVAVAGFVINFFEWFIYKKAEAKSDV